MCQISRWFPCFPCFHTPTEPLLDIEEPPDVYSEESPPPASDPIQIPQNQDLGKRLQHVVGASFPKRGGLSPSGEALGSFEHPTKTI